MGTFRVVTPGLRLRQFRRRLGVSPAELAARMGYCEGYMRQLENGLASDFTYRRAVAELYEIEQERHREVEREAARLNLLDENRR